MKQILRIYVLDITEHLSSFLGPQIIRFLLMYGLLVNKLYYLFKFYNIKNYGLRLRDSRNSFGGANISWG